MKKWIIAAGAVLILITAAAIYIAAGNGSYSVFAGGKAYSVKAREIKKGTISSSVSASGTVEAVETASVYFDTPLKVKKILVEKNQFVTKGEKLVELDLEPLNAELEQLKISKKILENTILKIKTMDIAAGTSSLEAAADIAANNAASAEKAYKDAKDAYQDAEKLSKAGKLPKSELDKMEKAVQSMETAYRNAEISYKASLENLRDAKKANEKTESSRKIDIKTQEYNLMSTVLRINDLEKKISNITASSFSPLTGAVTVISVVEGAFTNSMAPAFQIVDTSRLQVKAYIKEFDIRNVQEGQTVRVTGDAIDPSVTLEGKIGSISPVAVKNRTATGEDTLFEVTIPLTAGNTGVKPGMSVTCDILTKNAGDVLIADLEMFMEDKDGNKSVFVIDQKDNTIHEKRITTGILSDMSAEVVEGLNEGDLVLIDPQPSYKDGARVRLAEDGQ